LDDFFYSGYVKSSQVAFNESMAVPLIEHGSGGSRIWEMGREARISRRRRRREASRRRRWTEL